MKERAEAIGSKKPDSETSRKAEALQAQLVDEVELLHLRLSNLTPGRVHEEAKAEIPKISFKRTVDILFDDAGRIEMLLRTAPPGYYIEAEITSRAYYSLGSNRFQFLEKRKTPDSVRYFLYLGRPLMLRSGKIAEFLLEAKKPTEGFVLPFFSVAEKQGLIPIQRYLNLRDILNFKVTPFSKQ